MVIVDMAKLEVAAGKCGAMVGKQTPRSEVNSQSRIHTLQTFDFPVIHKLSSQLICPSNAS